MPGRLGGAFTGWRSGLRMGLLSGVPILGAAGAATAIMATFLIGCTALMMALERMVRFGLVASGHDLDLAAVTHLGSHLRGLLGAVADTGVALARGECPIFCV